MWTTLHINDLGVNNLNMFFFGLDGSISEYLVSKRKAMATEGQQVNGSRPYKETEIN